MSEQATKIVAGQKHLVQCRCFLPHLKNLQNPPNHSFVVFSLINDDESVVEKQAQCNNCGVIHRVYDICRSEILPREKSGSIMTEKDISLMIPTALSELLLNYSCDISTWEHAHYIITYQKWGESIILSKENADGFCNGKKLTILSLQQMKVESFSYAETF